MELKRTGKGQLYGDLYLHVNSKQLFCCQFNHHQMPSMEIPSCNHASPALPILTQPWGSASLAAAFPAETLVGFLFLEMVVVKAASDYYLQSFACSHGGCENPDPDPAAAELCQPSLAQGSTRHLLNQALKPLPAEPPRMGGNVWKVTRAGM